MPYPLIVTRTHIVREAGPVTIEFRDLNGESYDVLTIQQDEIGYAAGYRYTARTKAEAKMLLATGNWTVS